MKKLTLSLLAFIAVAACKKPVEKKTTAPHYVSASMPDGKYYYDTH